MFLIENITADAKQKSTIKLPDGSTFLLRMEYIPMQQGWFIRQLTYGDFEINNMRICNSPNMLHQFHNRLPFGIACYSKDDREPMLLQDFFSGASKMYLTTFAENTDYTEYLSGI